MSNCSTPDTGKPSRIAVISVLLLFSMLMLITLSSCKDFFGTVDLKEEIEEEVSIANAPEVTVTFLSENDRMGVPSPNGRQVYKVGLEYDITTTVGADYYFVEWTHSGDSGDVTFTDAALKSTTIIINRQVDGLTITPTFSPEPVVVVNIRAEDDKMGVPNPYGSQTLKIGYSYSLDTTVGDDYAFVHWSHTGEEGDVTFGDETATSTEITVNRETSSLQIIPVFDRRPYVRTWTPYSGSQNNLTNAEIIVTFNEPVAADSIVLGEQGSVQITTVKTTRKAEDPRVHVESNFAASVVEGSLALSLADDNYHDIFSTIEVTLTSNITDVAGNPMVDDFTWFFETGSGKDETPPSITDFSVINSAGNANIFTPGQDIILNITAEDDYTEPVELRVTETPWSSNDDTGAADGSSTTHPDTDFLNESDFTVPSDNQWIKISVQVADKSGNWSAEDNPDGTVYVYWDTAGPTIGSFAIDDGELTNSTSINVTASSINDIGSGIGGYAISESSDPATISTWSDASPSTFTISSGDGLKTVYFHVKDLADNTVVSSDTIYLDQTAPTVSADNIDIAGGSGVNGAFKIGDTVTATWNNTSGGDNNADISSVSVDFTEFGGGSVAATESSGTWTASYLLASGSIDALNRNVSVTPTDDAGNATDTADSSNATVDTIAPVVTAGNISITGGTGTGGAYKIGDTVTATWDNTGTGDNNGDISSVSVDFSEFGGGPVAASNSGNVWTASYPLTAGSIDALNRNVSVTATDDAGNATGTVDTSNASVDTIGPVRSTAGIITLSSDVNSNGIAAIGDGISYSPGAISSADGDTWTVDLSAYGLTAEAAAGTYTIIAGDSDAAFGATETVTDDAGNTATGSVTADFTIDNQAPEVSDGNISLSGASGTDGAFKIGDTVTATWNNTSGGDNNADISSVSVDFTEFGGGSVAATESSGTWTASYLLASGSIDALNRNVSVTATDDAGNATDTADSSNATVDTIAPAVTAAHISIAGASGTGGAFKIGDTVTASWDNTGTGDNNGDISSVSVDFSEFGGGPVDASNSGNVWTASYELTSGSIDALNRNVSVTATDDAGNATGTVDTSNASVDTIGPVRSTAGSITLSSDVNSNGIAAIGDGISYSPGAISSADGDTWTVDLSAYGLTAEAAAGTYTIIAGDSDAAFGATETVTDDAGNTATGSVTADFTIDNQAPEVSDGNISLSGASGTDGAFKIGDTVTATWDNTSGGDNNSDISSVSVDFTEFGGGSVAATESSGTWTATYTIESSGGAIPVIDSMGFDVSVTAVDDAGNSTTTEDTTEATVDNTVLSVTDTNISITSTGSGTGETYIIGDTVIAEWDNTGAGDNNSDTIASVTVDFSAFGGGAAFAATNSSDTWTASYTIGSGALDTTGLTVSVTATDDAGNSITTEDTTEVAVDNTAPTVTDFYISLTSTGSGTGETYIIGDTVTAEWDNTGTGDNNSDTIASVTVDFSAFGGGAAFAATNNSNTWTASYTIESGTIEATDLNVLVTATDDAGNSTTMADTTGVAVDNKIEVVTDITYSSGASADTFADNVVTWTDAGSSIDADEADGITYYLLLGADGSTIEHVKTVYGSKTNLDTAVSDSKALNVVATTGDDGSTGLDFDGNDAEFLDLRYIGLKADGTDAGTTLEVTASQDAAIEIFIVSLDGAGNIEVATTGNPLTRSFSPPSSISSSINRDSSSPGSSISGFFRSLFSGKSAAEKERSEPRRNVERRSRETVNTGQEPYQSRRSPGEPESLEGDEEWSWMVNFSRADEVLENLVEKSPARESDAGDDRAASKERVFPSPGTDEAPAEQPVAERSESEEGQALPEMDPDTLLDKLKEVAYDRPVMEDVQMASPVLVRFSESASPLPEVPRPQPREPGKRPGTSFPAGGYAVIPGAVTASKNDEESGDSEGVVV